MVENWDLSWKRWRIRTCVNHVAAWQTFLLCSAAGEMLIFCCFNCIFSLLNLAFSSLAVLVALQFGTNFPLSEQKTCQVLVWLFQQRRIAWKLWITFRSKWFFKEGNSCGCRLSAAIICSQQKMVPSAFARFHIFPRSPTLSPHPRLEFCATQPECCHWDYKFWSQLDKKCCQWKGREAKKLVNIFLCVRLPCRSLPRECSDSNFHGCFQTSTSTT